jgi:hypothetical protein
MGVDWVLRMKVAAVSMLCYMDLVIQAMERTKLQRQ